MTKIITFGKNVSDSKIERFQDYSGAEKVDERSFAIDESVDTGKLVEDLHLQNYLIEKYCPGYSQALPIEVSLSGHRMKVNDCDRLYDKVLFLLNANLIKGFSEHFVLMNLEHISVGEHPVLGMSFEFSTGAGEPKESPDNYILLSISENGKAYITEKNQGSMFNSMFKTLVEAKLFLKKYLHDFSQKIGYDKMGSHQIETEPIDMEKLDVNQILLERLKLAFDSTHKEEDELKRLYENSLKNVHHLREMLQKDIRTVEKVIEDAKRDTKKIRRRRRDQGPVQEVFGSIIDQGSRRATIIFCSDNIEYDINKFESLLGFKLCNVQRIVKTKYIKKDKSIPTMIWIGFLPEELTDEQEDFIYEKGIFTDYEVHQKNRYYGCYYGWYEDKSEESQRWTLMRDYIDEKFHKELQYDK